MAYRLLSQDRIRVKSRMVRNILHRLAGNEATAEADMLSYLLFDGGFAKELLDLGYEDARAHEDELLRVFGD